MQSELSFAKQEIHKLIDEKKSHELVSTTKEIEPIFVFILKHLNFNRNKISAIKNYFLIGSYKLMQLNYSTDDSK